MQACPVLTTNVSGSGNPTLKRLAASLFIRKPSPEPSRPHRFSDINFFSCCICCDWLASAASWVCELTIHKMYAVRHRIDYKVATKYPGIMQSRPLQCAVLIVTRSCNRLWPLKLYVHDLVIHPAYPDQDNAEVAEYYIVY